MAKAFNYPDGVVSQPTLVVISPGFPKDEHDSTCLPAQQMFFKTFRKQYPTLNIIVLALHYPYTTQTYRWNKIDVIPLNGRRYGRWARPMLWLVATRQLRRLSARSNHLQILSLWCQETALIAARFSRRAGVHHWSWILGQDARASNFFVRWIRPKPHRLIALSDFLADTFEQNHAIRPRYIIPNALDYTLFNPNPTSARTTDILGVGSLILLKRFDIFLAIVARLKQTFPGIRAVLCGKGPEEKRLQRMTRDLALDKNVTFLGECAHYDTLKMMQSSKILLHPSSYEGYSTACLEALYAGCEVVSFTRAEKADIPQWHIVESPDEMAAKCETILRATSNLFPVKVHAAEDTTRMLGNLLGYTA